MRVTEVHNQILALLCYTVAYALYAQLLLEAFGNAYDHVVDQAAGRSLHHAIEHAVGFLASQNSHRLVVHAQQQGDHLPHSAAVEGREDRCRCRGSQCIAGACHCHTGGGAGAGRDRRDAARRLAGVDPDRSGAGAVIVDIVGVQSGICGRGIIAVDRRRDKGQLGGAIGHKGALHTAEQH